MNKKDRLRTKKVFSIRRSLGCAVRNIAERCDLRRNMLEKVATMILFLYIFAVFVGIYIADVSVNPNILMLAFLLVGATGFTIIMRRFWQSALNKRLNKKEISRKECQKTFGVVFVVFFALLMTFYYAYFPGSYDYDSQWQLEQAATGIYNDWHPFLQTFLFFTIPLKIFGAMEMIVFLQMLYFALAFAYLTMTVRKNGAPRWFCVMMVGIVALAPVTGDIMCYPWKDCGLAIFATIATAQYMNIILTRGEWLKKKRNILAFGVVMALTMLMRHNAILFVVPMLAIVLWFGWKKRKVVGAAIGVFLIMVTLVKWPMAQMLNVERPIARTLETVGAGMTIMANVVKNVPDDLDEEVANFLYRAAPKEVYEQKYVTGNFNSMKWDSRVSVDVFDDAGVGKILGYTTKTILRTPRWSAQAFLRLTGVVWKLDGDTPWAWTRAELMEGRGRSALQETVAQMILDWGTFVNTTVLKYPMNYTGWIYFAIISLSLVVIRKRKDLRVACIGVPILCYGFGTASLLSSPWDWRFFYLTIPIGIPILFLIYRMAQKGEVKDGAK